MDTNGKNSKRRHDNFQQIIDECQEMAKSGNYIFRGAGCPCVLGGKAVQSTLYRKYRKNGISCKDVDFFKIERDIISQARYLFNSTDKYIKILTELRHFGDDLAVIDFTKDINVALFFACRFTLCERDVKNADKDGEVVFLEIPEIKSEIDYSAETYYAIEPDGNGSSAKRASSQRSIFIHSRQGFIYPDDLGVKTHTIRIENEFKGEIANYLQNNLKIDLHTMFEDVVGFIENKKHIDPIGYRLGVTSLQSKDFRNAIKLFDSVIDDNPHSHTALNSRGIAWSGLNESGKAIKDFSRAIELNPFYDTVYFNRGHEKYNNGDDNGAFLDYCKVIELNPKNKDAYLTRGYIYVEHKKYVEALADADSALRLEPESPAGINLRDIAKIVLCPKADAQIDEKQRDLIQRHISEAKKYILKKNYKLVIEESNKALELEPANISAFMVRGEAKFKKHEFAGAAYDFNLAVNCIKYLNEKKIPKLLISLCYLGLAKIGNLDMIGGIGVLSELLEINPNDSLALAGRGLALYSLGKVKESTNENAGATELFNQALVDLNKAIGIDPNLTEAVQHRALVNQSLGNEKQAEKDFLKYMWLKKKSSLGKAIRNIWLNLLRALKLIK